MVLVFSRPLFLLHTTQLCSWVISLFVSSIVVVNLLIISSRYLMTVIRFTVQVQIETLVFGSPRSPDPQWYASSLYLSHSNSMVTVLFCISSNCFNCEVTNSNNSLLNNDFLTSDYLLIYFHYKSSGLIRTSRQWVSLFFL